MKEGPVKRIVERELREFANSVEERFEIWFGDDMEKNQFFFEEMERLMQDRGIRMRP
jgi:hypothetical protein